MNRSRRHALLAPLLAVVALLLGLTGSASAAFNHAATEPHYGNFLLWEYEASGFSAYEFADPIKENGEWIYDGALGVPVYVRQNPWTYYDPYGLFEWSKVGESVGNTIYGVAELAQSLVGSVVEIGTGGLSGEGMNARRGEIMAGMVEGTVETAGGLIDASHQAVGGHWGAAAQTAAGTLGETPEEAVANGGLMVLTAGASRYLKGKGSAPTSSARGVAEGQVATRAELKAREITGDGLDIHEAPSQAAIKERLSQKLGRAPTPEELKRATDRLPATAIPTPVHAETRTFFNKNTKTQVKGDANDLDAAARADAESLSAAGYKKTASQMEKKWKKSELREELK